MNMLKVKKKPKKNPDMEKKDEDILEIKVSWRKIVREYVSSMIIYKHIIKNLGPAGHPGQIRTWLNDKICIGDHVLGMLIYS